MNINEFLDNLCLGELSNLYIGQQGLVELHPQNRMKLINYTNQGLKALHSRFVLLKKELIIRGKDHISLYTLSSKHSMKTGTSVVKYIDDTHCDPFNDDLIKILGVYNEIGLQFPMNDVNQTESVHTPSWNMLQIPHPIEGEGYQVIYQALSPVLGDQPDGCQHVDLPPVLEEALTNFVAGKVYSHMNGEANKLTSQEFMGVFEMKCAELVINDLGASSDVPTNYKAIDRGFV